MDPLADVEIKHQAVTVSTLHEQMVCWFRNHTKTITTSPSASMQPALVTFPGPPKKVTNISLFGEAHKAQITASMNTRCSALGLSTQHNLAQWILARDSLWNELTLEQQQEWQQRADAHNVTLENLSPPAEGHIFANQEHLQATLGTIFQGLVGTHPHGIGDAVYHVQFAYRDASGKVEMFSLGNYQSPGVRFAALVPDYSNQISVPFVHWAQTSLGSCASTTLLEASLDTDQCPDVPQVNMVPTNQMVPPSSPSSGFCCLSMPPIEESQEVTVPPSPPALLVSDGNEMQTWEYLFPDLPSAPPSMPKERPEPDSISDTSPMRMRKTTDDGVPVAAHGPVAQVPPESPAKTPGAQPQGCGHRWAHTNPRINEGVLGLGSSGYTGRKRARESEIAPKDLMSQKGKRARKVTEKGRDYQE
ncbi:hypothetical protein K439DRAFT_1618567 [Ramaria rubella]|nr:hypothetical protein K439DRAFT_1618567 [Ramaria rubella]